MSDYITGIDIGSSKVSAAVGKIDKTGNLQIVGITSSLCNGLKKGVVVDIDKTSESVKNCIEQLERMVDIKIQNAYISLPGGICELIWNKGVVAVSSEEREIRQNDIDRVLEASKLISISQDKQVIGVEVEQYIVDGYEEVTDPLGMSGSRLEADVNVIVSQASIVNNLCKSVEKAGIRVNGVVLQPTAVSQVILSKEEMSIGTALVDIGAETIDIAVYKGNSLCYTTMIPLGGNSITNDITICLNIPFNTAERLKSKYGTLDDIHNDNREKIKVNATYNEVIEVDFSMLTEIIKARVEEILDLIYKKLETSGYNNEVSGIVFVGGGISLFKGVTTFSKNIFNKPVRVGIPAYIGAASPVYAGAVGIVKDKAKYLKSEDVYEDSVERKSGFSLKHNVKEGNNIFNKIKEFFVEFF